LSTIILIGIDRLGLLLQNGGCQPFGGSECQWSCAVKKSDSGYPQI
jgi:hypothetical protein